MKKVKAMKLNIQKNGIDQYEKQTIEISVDGTIIHYLFPMAYMGTMKRYEFSVGKNEIEEFFDNFDFEKWPRVESKSFDSFSFNLTVSYDDNTIYKNEGYINLAMPDEYVEFDEKILDLVMFIEKPWLFTK